MQQLYISAIVYFLIAMGFSYYFSATIEAHSHVGLIDDTLGHCQKAKL
jgi:hypothetical protein